MAGYDRLHGERVGCHQCHHEWNRVQGGLICPNCNSEFTEVIEASHTRSRPEAGHLHPFHDHQPWQEADIPDPDEDNVRTYQWNSRGDNGAFSFTSRTFVSGGGRHGRNNLRDGPQPPQGDRAPFPFNGQLFGPPRHDFAPDQDGILRPQGREDIHNQAFVSAQDMFTMIFGVLNGPPRRAPDQPTQLAALLADLMGPRDGRDGDGVYTQEAFDQVMTQLMEQGHSSTGPPPASAEAINALPNKRVTADMMADGNLECSICMEDLEIGAEITVLPCDHSFHPDCIKHWLKEHDTCPHCRKPITDHSAQPTTPNSRRRISSTLRTRTPISAADPRASRPGDGSAHDPYLLPDSPSGIRERRQQYFSHRNEPDGVNLDRTRTRRSGSAQSITRPGGGRAGNQNSPPGGAMGWMRNHMPFGS